MLNERKNKVLFITTKNIDYLRNVQEINIIKKNNDELELIFSKGKNYFIRILDIYFQLLFKNMTNYKMVFIGFAPQLILPLFKWKFKKNYIIIDFFISIYDTLVFDRKIISNKNILSKLLHWIDCITLKNANEVIADTKAHANYFASEFTVAIEKIKVLYLKANEEIYYYKEIEKEKKLEKKFVVLYFGSILPLQGIEIVLDTIKILKDESNIFFLIIGPLGNKMEKYESANVEYIDWLSEKKLSDKIAASDLCLAGHFNADIDKANRTIPGKAYIYEAMGKDMILGDTSANHELFSEKDKNVYFVKRGSSVELAKKIKYLANERARSNEN